MTNKLASDLDPIAAIATGSANGAIAIIRLSGENSQEFLEKALVFHGKTPWQAMQVKRASFVDHQNNKALDDILAVFFKGPRSYTGQDSVELYFHASPYILQKALKILYALGFRAAEPGEFTRRAFLNGKLDLTQAEGINELISAQSEQQWQAAQKLSSGSLKKLSRELREELSRSLALIEARIDFPDEQETSDIQDEMLLAPLRRVKKILRELLLTYDNGKIAQNGLKVALVGSPNSGKSTLMNTLLKTNRALVTEEAGTTRDYLEESCLINGRLIRLIDTAGLRRTNDKIERLGIEKTYEIAKKADLVFYLLPADKLNQEREKIDLLQAKIKAKNYHILMSKADLLSAKERSQNDHLKMISSHCQSSIKKLENFLSNYVDQSLSSLEEIHYITSARHKNALDSALQSINSFEVSYRQGAFDECLAFELQEAIKALAELIGEVHSDEILGRIFTEFCLGK